MASMRWVTRKPPMTLIVAKIIARKPNSDPQRPSPATNAPTNVIPLMAFEPLINGVCSVGGTLVMTSTPTKMASTKIVMPVMISMSADPK